MSDLVIFMIAQFTFVSGFLLGRITGGSSGAQEQQKTFFSKPNTPAKIKAVKIDDAKFVTKVTSDSFVKKGTELGKNSSVDDDIASSASKLAQLKRGK